jgi:hypothetical protein
MAKGPDQIERELSPYEKAQRALAPADGATLQITLVPGTWAYGFFRRRATLYHPARPPRWFEENSAFRSALESELRRMGFDFTINVLQWDGANSVHSRATQTELLAKDLERQRSPGVRRVIIAHSHGGNIARKAASLVKTGGNDLAIVTLATPFLQASPRHEDSPRLILDILFSFLGFMSVAAFLTTTAQSKLVVGLKTLGVWALLVAYFLYKWKSDEKIANAINSPVLAGVPFLAIRGFSDEASASIVLGSIGAGLMNAMLYILAFPIRWFTASRGRIVVMILCVYGGVVILTKTAAIIFKVISIWTVIASLAALQLVPIAIAGAFASLFGRELFFESLNLVLTTDSVPDCDGNTDVVTLSETHTSLSGLRHGLYAHAGCPRLIAYWLATGQTWHYLNDVPYSVEQTKDPVTSEPTTSAL